MSLNRRKSPSLKSRRRSSSRKRKSPRRKSRSHNNSSRSSSSSLRNLGSPRRSSSSSPRSSTSSRCQWTLAELKNLCRNEDLSCSGNKDTLCRRLTRYYNKLEENKSVSKKFYSPKKYFKGLSPSQKKKRLSEIDRRRKQPRNYSPFKTDRGIKTKSSVYTKAFTSLFPEAKSLSQKAKVTGIPLDILERVYDKGLQAWTTGHRPGATAGQWGYARVNSFIMKGCTHYSPDNNEVAEAKRRSQKAVRFWKSIECMCKKGCKK